MYVGTLLFLLCFGAQGNPPAVPACEKCGGAREFEMQLMPPLIDAFASVVKVKKMTQPSAGGAGSATSSGGASERQHVPPTLDGLDFGTVLVYSCPASCEGGQVEWPVVVPAI
jgi:hypothetical protein